jgi:ABC-type antimicrobial peptide transport system permease subunit
VARYILGLSPSVACVVLYGVTAYGVARRTNKIGLRMALGAEREHVLWMVLRGTLWLMAVGVCIGLPLALAASRLGSNMLLGLKPTDPVTITTATLIMFTIADLARLPSGTTRFAGRPNGGPQI